MALSCLSCGGIIWVGVGSPGYPCPNQMLKVMIGTLTGEMAVTKPEGFRSSLHSFLADSLYFFIVLGLGTTA